MRLSDTDKENIEVLESLSIDENALLGLFCLYFNYRYKRRTSGKYGLMPNQALQETITTAMKATEEEETRKRSRLTEITHIAEDYGLYD